MKKPRQQGFNFDYEEVEEDGHATAYGGVPLVGELLQNFHVSETINQHVDLGYEARHHDPAWCVESLVMLLSIGGECLDDLHLFTDDAALTKLVDRPFPSPETVRRFLYACHDDELVLAAQSAALANEESSYVPTESQNLQGLHQGIKKLVHEVAKRGNGKLATIDIDASIHNSSKREALEHYKGGRGYQPIIALWAEQDLIVADEFRDGNVPAGKDTVRIAEKAFDCLPASITKRRLRGDSALYSHDMLRWLDGRDIEYSISASMSTQLKKACLAVDESGWQPYEDRRHESVHIAELSWCPSSWPKSCKPLRFVGIRFSPKQGSLFDQPKYLAVVTNRSISASALVRWHWEKAGTVEHAHRVLKHELGAETFPCGRFGANAAWYRIAVLTYNALSALRSVAFPPRFQDIRPKRMRLLLLVQVAQVISHARRIIARVRKRLRDALEIPPIRTAILPA